MQESSIKTTHLANPGVFRRLTGALLPIMGVASVFLLICGMYYSFWGSPADYQQGEAVRMLYIHVPSAMLSMGLYAGMAVASFIFLVWKHGIADLAARAMAPVGMVLTLITLASGAIWGKPMWGAWWVWDARLTSVLILFFLYLGYIAVGAAFEQGPRGRKVAAIYSLLGSVNLPVIHFSVEWWNTLHQPSSLLRQGGSGLHPEMQTPLFLMLAGLALWCAVLVVCRIQTLQLQQKIRRMELKRTA